MVQKLKKKCLDFLMKQRMKNILYVVLLALTVCISGFIGCFVIEVYRRDMDQAAGQNNRKLADQLNASVTQYVHQMIRISDTLYYNVLKKDTAYVSQVSQAMYETYRDSIVSIAIFSMSGELLYVSPALSLSPWANISKEAWFLEAFDSSENIHFFNPALYDYFVQDKAYSWIVPMSRYVQINEGSRVTEGVLLISIKYSAFAAVFGNSAFDRGKYSFLMDSGGSLVYHPKHAQISAGFAQVPPKELSSYPDGSYQMEIDGMDVLCCVETVGYTGWRLVSVSSRAGLRLAGLKFQLFVIAVILFLLLASIVLGSYVSNVLTNPIKKLETDVKKISEGNLNLTVHSSGSFEVYHLGESIQKMAVKIRQLMEEIIKEQEEKRKSELDSLQAQITPHFLYNTLDGIVWMIEQNRKEDASKMVTSLARLLRISISKGKHIIPLEDEFEHVRNYLAIQSMRFKNKFTYDLAIQPETRGLAVIKLIVQPIVENAIYHGMEGMYEDGEILVSAYKEGNDFYISVKDNGMGMRKEQANALLDYGRQVQTRSGNGLGVRNVHERIRLYFGKEYGVSIHSVLDEGTQVLLHLPVILFKEEEG